MLPKIPKTLLVAGLALPLTVTLPSIKAVESTRSAISIGVSDAIAAPLEAATEEIEYVQDGRQRILRAKGKDLNALHSTASREFLRRLEEEIKKPDARLTIANFETSIRFENGEFIFEYRARLNPASSQNEVHTLISMRGTVWCGRDAKTKVLEENRSKVPGWQQRIGAAYPGMKIWYESAQSENGSPQGTIFHEAVLAKGAVQN